MYKRPAKLPGYCGMAVGRVGGPGPWASGLAVAPSFCFCHWDCLSGLS